MVRFASAVLIVACLLTLSACRQAATTSTLEIQEHDIEEGTITFSFTIDKAGWLVLHPATSEGEPDTSEELGKSYIPSAGEWTNDRATPEAVETDCTFFMVLYYDEPADGVFTFTPGGNQDPPVEVEGEIVQDSFTVPAAPSYVELTQNVSNNTITIEGLTYQAGLLVVLRPATPEGELDTSTMIKVWEIPYAGPFKFTVTTPGTLDEGDILFAVLHYDDPDDNLFSFTPDGDEDLPVKVDGSVVLDSLEVSG
ncbi:MAG TPA: hypothetical protein G4O10_03330 [Dehalococcoidia bacterium]|nr:hypothetical protein [Dehalococcoidia bacterium]